jgi:processive 1,2-diacylglycerol beta-glucosyltransferase
MEKKKIIIFHAEAGAGHRQAASALKQIFNEVYPEIEVSAVDPLDFTPKYFKKIYANSYTEIVKHIPELWGYLYDRSYGNWSKKQSEKIHKSIERIHGGKLCNFVLSLQPAALVFTHFLAIDILEKYKKAQLKKVPFYCVVTDYAIHPFWVNSAVDKYYVSTEDEKRLLLRCGFPSEKVVISGIPVEPRFAKPFDRIKLREKLGLEPSTPTVLMISGRYDFEGFKKFLASFSEIDFRFNVIVLAGKDKKLFDELKKVADKVKKKMPVYVYGYVPNMEELMGASDIVVTKPGGLTTAEVLSRKCLIGIISPIPGQEQRNSDYLLEAGVGVRIHDMELGAFKLRDLFLDKERLSRMFKNLDRISRPRAGYLIVKDIISDLKIRRNID